MNEREPRFALISDVHSNLEALEAVLARTDADDGVLCLGDIVGYGPDPNACLALLRKRISEAVLGNHDVAAIDDFGIEHFNPAARAAIVWTQGVLAVEHAEWLRTLGYEWRAPEFLMVHGAPVEYFEYVLDVAAAKRAFAATDAPLVFLGHTHIAEYYALEPGGRIRHAYLQHGGELALDPGTRYLVNPGSVGQPRDLNPEASLAFYSPEARRVVWERVPYAIERVRAKIAAAHLPPANAERLRRGR
ncbi:MAG: metallophosphoesterase family protein [Candidatus Baltobacteraceae bacterium]